MNRSELSSPLAPPVLRFQNFAGEPSHHGDGALVDVPLLDWDDLFKAVKERLRLIVYTHAAILFELRLPDDARRVDRGVLECVAALDQLHATMTHERACRVQLEHELAATRAALDSAARKPA